MTESAIFKPLGRGGAVKIFKKKESSAQLLREGGVCRRVLATPGLLTSWLGASLYWPTKDCCSFSLV